MNEDFYGTVIFSGIKQALLENHFVTGLVALL
jgi:hypothetical protein